MKVSGIRTLTIAAGLAVISGAGWAAGSSEPAVYTSAQAQQGADVFSSHCARCHGSSLGGGAGPALKGTSFEKMAQNQGLNAATLRAFISQHMPLTNPGSLDKTQYDEVTAYILKENGYPAGSTKLTPSSSDAKSLTFSSSSSSSGSSSSTPKPLSSKY